MTDRIDTEVCVVGGGPAGLTFALALAKRGHEVVVLEKGQNFERNFRGESISPDSVWLLDRLGVLDSLRERKILDVRRIELQDNGRTVLQVDFGAFDRPVRYPVEVPQPMLLGALAEAAGECPGFSLQRQASVTELIFEDGRVAGARARTPQGPVEVRAKLTVGADGRYSKVRDWARIPFRKIPLARDFLWFSLPCPEAWSNDTYRVRISGEQHAMCIPTYPDLVRVGFNIPKNGLKDLRSQGIGALHERIAVLAPELLEGVTEHVSKWSDTSMLEIFTSISPKWSAPGLVLIGDAAHTLSPVLAQGVNHAIIDGVALAPIVSHSLRRPNTEDALDAGTDRFQRIREPEVNRARMLQMRQERLFTLSAPMAQAARRAVYRVVNHTPLIKQRLWDGLYYAHSRRGETDVTRGRAA